MLIAILTATATQLFERYPLVVGMKKRFTVQSNRIMWQGDTIVLCNDHNVIEQIAEAMETLARQQSHQDNIRLAS